MAYTINFTQSNQEDWGFFIQAKSTIDGSDIDFTDAEINVAVRDPDGCHLLTGSTLDGRVTLPQTTVVKVLFPETSMSQFCAGTYRVGATFTLNGSTIQLLTGNLAIYDGIVRT
jgi:hypothetical protein